jgi:hypothetical protein
MSSGSPIQEWRPRGDRDPHYWQMVEPRRRKMPRSDMRAKEDIFETLWLCCRVTLGSLLLLDVLIVCPAFD